MEKQENKKEVKDTKGIICAIMYLIGFGILMIPAIVELIKLFTKNLYAASIIGGFGLIILSLIISLIGNENKNKGGK